jgi:TPR repeat protein
LEEITMKKDEIDELAEAYKFGELGDYPKAIREYKRTSANGNVHARWELGCMYYLGHNVPQDFKRAAIWLKKAAEAGHKSSAKMLVTLYQMGAGVKKDDKRALFWLLKAAEWGDFATQFQVGWMYYQGSGVAEDRVEAAKWWTVWSINAKRNRGPQLPLDVKEAMRKLPVKDLVEARRRAAELTKPHTAKKK